MSTTEQLRSMALQFAVATAPVGESVEDLVRRADVMANYMLGCAPSDQAPLKAVA